MRNSGELRETADAIVIGGGVIGLAIARALAARALSVTLVERAAHLGAEASAAAAGMLAPQAEANGRDAFFDLLCAGRALYPAFAESLREETGIDIELDRTGTLYLALTEADEKEISARYEWQRSAGLDVEQLTPVEARGLEPALAPNLRLALKFPADVQVENRRLVAALGASLEARGIRVRTETEVTAVRIERGRVNHLETTGGSMSAGAVVFAAGAWTSLVPLIAPAPPAPVDSAAGSRLASPRIEPVRGQMLCFDARPPLVRHVVYSPRGYIVPRRDGRLLAGATVEHAGFDKSVTAAGAHRLLTSALEIAPAIGRLALTETWAGLRPRAQDEWPVLGACAEVGGLYYATGHYRNGILLAPITGELIADAVVRDRVSPLLAAFAPERFRRTYSVMSNGD